MSGTWPISANISTLFRELPLLERFEAARSRGFDGVEIQVPYSESPEALGRAAEAAGMPVVLINAPVVAAEHPFGIAGRPELAALFRAQLARAAEYAEALRVRFVHVLAGTAPPEADRERILRTYEDHLSLAADVLRPQGVAVLIEPLNAFDVPGYLLQSFDLARSILSRCPPGIGMQFDAYHATRMGLDPANEIGRSLPYVRHVQFADVPGRHEPGTGTLPFDELLSALARARYAGWLGAEYFPITTTDRSLDWLAGWRAAMGAPAAAPDTPS